jgi:hypothetical protein
MKKLITHIIILFAFFSCSKNQSIHFYGEQFVCEAGQILSYSKAVNNPFIPDDEELELRLNYLDRVVAESSNSESEISLLGRQNYEWSLFTFAFTSYAYTNLVLQDSSLKKRGEEVIKLSIIRFLGKNQRESFNIDIKELFKTDIPDYSILYLGHLNLMIGCYRLISSDDSFDQINRNISESLIKRYNESSYLLLESYDNSIWIPDNSVAMASIKLYSINEKNNSDTLCEKWINNLKNNYIDKELDVLYSKVDPESGRAIEEPRGSMLGWSIMFIYQIDSKFAKSQYRSYKKNFCDDYLTVKLFRERHNETSTNSGDIDSGPILWGYSIPANQFALGDAILSGDYITAEKLLKLINLGTKQIISNNEYKYETLIVKMNISPMAEALMLYSLTMRNWSEKSIRDEKD